MRTSHLSNTASEVEDTVSDVEQGMPKPRSLEPVEHEDCDCSCCNLNPSQTTGSRNSGKNVLGIWERQKPDNTFFSETIATRCLTG